MGKNKPNSHPFYRTDWKKIGFFDPEELARIIEGLNEIIGS
jgi:hypothetical protein